MIKMALMGHGVVGSGVAELFFKHKKDYEKKVGDELDLKYILDLRDFPDLEYSDRFTKDFDDIINDDEIKIVVEVMGGVGAAYSFVKQCLQKGKSVATSNKELVATHGAELLKIAKEQNANFLFEASVGGGIPIIRPIFQCLSANDILEIDGILNGTTNYILTKMIEGNSFEDALKTAQELGYAERDPSADVEGADACRKICILAALAFGKHVYPDWVHTEGITKITLDDVDCASKAGYVIKLIGRTTVCGNGSITAAVYPAFVPKTSQLSGVDDVFNAILVRGDAVSDAVFYGRGAGKLPTASAVVADVIDCAKHIEHRRRLDWDDCTDATYVKPISECDAKMFIRAKADSTIADKVKSAFGTEIFAEKDGVVAFFTNTDKESVLDEKLANLDIVSKIRVLDEI